MVVSLVVDGEQTLIVRVDGAELVEGLGKKLFDAHEELFSYLLRDVLAIVEVNHLVKLCDDLSHWKCLRDEREDIE